MSRRWPVRCWPTACSSPRRPSSRASPPPTPWTRCCAPSLSPAATSHPMLTRQGWLVVWGGVVLVALARLLGINELYVFGAVALGLVAFALLYVRLTRLDVEIDRTVHPARVHAGQVSRVEVRLRNLRRTDTPVLRLRAPVSGTAGAELLVPPLDRGAATLATYRLPTGRRGIVR